MSHRSRSPHTKPFNTKRKADDMSSDEKASEAELFDYPDCSGCSPSAADMDVDRLVFYKEPRDAEGPASTSSRASKSDVEQRLAKTFGQLHTSLTEQFQVRHDGPASST